MCRWADPEWFEKTQFYYEQALRAKRTVGAVFQYAYFLQKHNQFSKAQRLYEEALKIYRAPAAENPSAYLPDVAVTLINLSISYLQAVPEKEKSIAAAQEAIELLLPFYQQAPYLQKYREAAFGVLKENGVDVESFPSEGR